jgi:multiple sugar transport system substrate-binding protein
MSGAMLLLVLTACGETVGGSRGEAPAANPASANEIVSGELSGAIDFWIYQPNNASGQEAMDALKAKFEQANPGATVNIVYVPKGDYNTKLNTSIATNSQPDASFLDQPLVARFVDDGVLEPAPDGLIDEATFYAGALNTNRVGGVLYGLPLSQTCVMLFYNTELVPAAPQTWDAMVQIARDIHEQNPDIAAFETPHYGGDWAGWLFPAFVATAGGQMLDEENQQVTFAEPPAVEALALWKELFQYSPPAISDAQNAFANGRVAMKISGPWEVEGLRTNFPKLQWNVAPIPQRVQPGTNIGGENGVVFKNSDNKILAWAWLSFLTESEHNLELNDKVLGNFPIRIDVAESAWAQADPVRPLFLDQLQYAQPRPRVKEWLQINDEIVGKAIEEAIDGDQDPQQALQAGAAKAAELLGWQAAVSP